jgi:putative Holliday junction resolvase
MPEARSSPADAPGAEALGVATPGSATPGSVTPGTVTPGAATPGTATPGAATRGAATPGAAAPQIVLAFDFGQRRIGVACGDTVSRGASHARALACPSQGIPWEAVDALIREWRPGVLVVGLPYNVDDSESAAAARARSFAGALAARYALPVELVDERYSSVEAVDRLRQARASGLRKRRVAKSDIDAAAARVILERWFNQKK